MARRFRTSTVMASRCCPLNDLLILCGCSCKAQHQDAWSVTAGVCSKFIAFDRNSNTLTTKKMSKGRTLCPELARADSLELKNWLYKVLTHGFAREDRISYRSITEAEFSAFYIF